MEQMQYESLPFFVFLDVDGVLNNQRTFNHSPNGFTGIDDENLRVFDKALSLIDIRHGDAIISPCSIILSSTWKMDWKNHGKPNKDGRYLSRAIETTGHEIKDFTQDDETSSKYTPGWTRGAGIRRYLESHSHEGYIILDDESFDFKKEGLSAHFLQTDFRTGLIEEDFSNIRRILSEELPVITPRKEIYEHFGLKIGE